MSVRHVTKRCVIQVSQDFLSTKLRSGFFLPPCLEKAALKRQCEFLAGRSCAVEALKELGIKTPMQPCIGTYGEPMWPSGVAGSISHHNRQAVAVVTNEKVVGIGIDIETWLLPNTAAEILPSVITTEELDIKPTWLELYAFLTIVYSAKESLFKALFNQVRDYLNFSAAKFVTMDRDMSGIMLSLTQKFNDNLPTGRIIRANTSVTTDGVETIVLIE